MQSRVSVRGQAETVGQGHRDRAPTKVAKFCVSQKRRSVFVYMICLCKVRQPARIMFVCDRYSGAPHIRDAKNL